MRVDLALIGFGHVGQAFVRLLDSRRDRLLRDWKLDCRITGIATRSRGAVVNHAGIDGVAASLMVEAGGALHDLGEPATDVVAVVDRVSAGGSDVRIVVETTTLNIADGQPAIGHVRAALERGCHVVTANKGPAAFAYHELAALAAARRRAFLFEGAVMDGIPIFSLVRETLPAVEIAAFRGVINSTTNHILTALEEGEAFAPALARMQADGIAEADPSLDVDGWDAAAKAAVLANVFFDARVTPHDVVRAGIDADTAARARQAVANGCRLRLIASGARGERPSVRLVELPHDDILAGLRGTANALIVETDLLGRIAIGQMDGGLIQTAYALLGDMLAVTKLVRR
jgi:homoserine dehydrogenase